MIIYNDKITLMLPISENGKVLTNDYGKAHYEYLESVAHIRHEKKNLFNEKGEQLVSHVQIYVPYNQDTKRIDAQTKFGYYMPNHESKQSKYQSIEYGQNTMGKTEFIKVYL